jgi:serine/threonine protein kinase
MHQERVLTLVLENYECNLWEAIECGYSVHVRGCLESVVAGIRHLHSLAIVPGDIKPDNILVELPKGVHDPISTRYVICTFNSAQPTGWKICGKYGTPF